jgi:hypothetical protein
MFASGGSTHWGLGDCTLRGSPMDRCVTCRGPSRGFIVDRIVAVLSKVSWGTPLWVTPPPANRSHGWVAVELWEGCQDVTPIQQRRFRSPVASNQGLPSWRLATPLQLLIDFGFGSFLAFHPGY